MRPSVRLNPESILENRYKVVRLITEGENTRVYEGRHIVLDLPVVIKQLRRLYPDPVQAAEQVEKYQSDARLLARMRHPNLVVVYDTFTNHDLPFIIMEMVYGRNLQEINELAPGPLSEKRVLQWAHQLFEVLEFLHGQHPPVIVRGLQPSNIILDTQGRLRLIDFGLAKSMDERGTQNIVKGMGQDGFAPLEQGAYSKTDERSDIYSLGATLYYLLTQKTPPSASERALAPQEPLSDPREFNETVRVETWQALQRMMALRAADRPVTVSEARALFPEPLGSVDESGFRLCLECKIPLLVEVLDGVEIDRCEVCGGLWLDKGELEQLRVQMEEYVERTDDLIRTMTLKPDRGAIEQLEKQRETSLPLWKSLSSLFGRKKG